MVVGAETEASLLPNRLIRLGPFHNGGNDPLRITVTDVEGGRSICSGHKDDSFPPPPARALPTGAPLSLRPLPTQTLRVLTADYPSH